jgi:lipopolysaccharide export system permease LptF/LptG-like protein
VQWFGSEALELTYKTPAGKVANELLYRHDEPRIDVVEFGRPWSFDGDGALFRLVSEAHRIRLAHLFDPVLAVHTSVVEPLPHQITVVRTGSGLAIPLAGRVQRHPSLATIFGTGLATGFGYWVTLALTKALGTSGVLPPVVSAWAANVIFLFVGVAIFLTSE